MRNVGTKKGPRAEVRVIGAARPPIAYFSLSVGMTVLILLRHPNNIRRLLAGTEPRLGECLSLGATADAPSPNP